METFLEYLHRKITRQKADTSKILFSTRVKQNIFFCLFVAPYKLIIAFRNSASNAYNNDLQKRITLLENAIIDPQGLGKIDLMLHNAHIPKRYYEIFYKLPFVMQSTQNLAYSQNLSASKTQIWGGG